MRTSMASRRARRPAVGRGGDGWRNGADTLLVASWQGWDRWTLCQMIWRPMRAARPCLV